MAASRPSLPSTVSVIRLAAAYSTCRFAGKEIRMDDFDPNPPDDEDVIAAGEWKYGLAQEAD